MGTIWNMTLINGIQVSALRGSGEPHLGGAQRQEQ